LPKLMLNKSQIDIAYFLRKTLMPKVSFMKLGQLIFESLLGTCLLAFGIWLND